MLRQVHALRASPALHLVDLRCSPTTPAQICTTTMCRYDFCLFGTCGHLVAGAVVEYCEKAVAPAATFSDGLREYFPGYHVNFFLFSPYPCRACSYPQRGSISLTFYQIEQHRCKNSTAQPCRLCLCPLLAVSASCCPDQARR